MTIAELVTLIHKSKRGASVELTSINIPDHSRGGLYGIVTLGGRTNLGLDLQRTFHSEEELRSILENA